MSSFVSELEGKHQGENILIISHGEPLWLLEGWAKRLKEKDLSEDGIKLNYIQPGELRKLN
jgi:broad specificity phosphatase PhoE